MRNYWLKIVLGMFAVFGLGMLGYSAVQAGKRKATRVAHSTDPITIPLAFVPFSVNGATWGTMSRVQLLRSTPQKVKAINLQVKLADSVPEARLATCVLMVGGPMQNVEAAQLFRCVPAADTVGLALQQIGELSTEAGRTFVLVGPVGTLDSLEFDFAEETSDSIARAAEAQAESLAVEHERMADSLQRHVDSVVSAIEPQVEAKVQAALEKAAAARARARDVPVPAPPAVPPKP